MTNVRTPGFGLLDADRDSLGEGPWWSVREQRLYWVDVTGHRVRASDLDGRDVKEWATPAEVGFAVPDAQGQLVVGLPDGLARLDPATGELRDGPEADRRGDHRLSHGKTDRVGRLWFGSMHQPETEPSSRFYRLCRAGLTTVFDDVITSNGLGWSPDDSIMYFTDSITGQIRAFTFDLATGDLRDGRVFAEDPAGEYVPGGLTVDADGCVWAAKRSGGRVIRYAPDGTPLLDMRFPVSRITSCMFVGRRLDILAVTSARGPGDDEPLAGRVFLIDPGTVGAAGTTGMAETPVEAGVLAGAGLKP